MELGFASILWTIGSVMFLVSVLVEESIHISTCRVVLVKKGVSLVNFKVMR